MALRQRFCAPFFGGETVRGQKVILDADLAAVYGVETKQLNRAVKRNCSRFPEEFMFRLTEEERLRCQNLAPQTQGAVVADICRTLSLSTEWLCSLLF
jgi:hypothetical protein